MLTGTIVNAVVVIIGSVVGVILGKKFPQKLSDTVMKGVALCVVCIGVDGMIGSPNMLITIISIVLGGILGELLRLDERIHHLGDQLEAKFSKNGKSRISEGFVSGSLLFCVGAMAVVGSLDSGLTGDHSTLYAKSTLDCISSIIFSTTMGIGVAFSALAILVYQGAITLCASFAAPFLGEIVIANMKCAGSLLILGLGLNLLGLTKIKVMNYVPAIFLPILLCLFM